MNLLTLRKEAERRAGMFNDGIPVRELCEKGAVDVVCKDERPPFHRLDKFIITMPISKGLIDKFPPLWDVSYFGIYDVGTKIIRFKICFWYRQDFSGLRRIVYKNMLKKFAMNNFNDSKITMEIFDYVMDLVKKNNETAQSI